MELFQDQRVYLQQSVNSCRLPVSLNSVNVEKLSCVEYEMSQVPASAYPVSFHQFSLHIVLSIDSPQLSMKIGRLRKMASHLYRQLFKRLTNW